MIQTRRQMVSATLLAAVLAVGLLSADVIAQGRSQGRGRGQGQSGGGGSDPSVSVVVVFRDNDRAIFRDYFVTHRIVAQPLPPGIAKNVARGKPLPPGIAKRAVPAGLLALGPRLDKDVSLAIVGDVVVATRSGVVIDVLVGAFK
jgi:hypothetical protein